MSGAPVRVIRAAECRRMPWKNGGGETIEIAVHPERAGLDEFDWRVSAARVATDGPFSMFPGVDRTLAILDGAGLELRVADDPPVLLRRGGAPHSFAADRPTEARLLAGPIQDLNVMTRRGRAGHRVRRLTQEEGLTRLAPTGRVLLFCAAGTLRLGDGLTLDPGDCAVFRDPGNIPSLLVVPATTAYVIDVLDPISPGRDTAGRESANTSQASFTGRNLGIV